MTLIEAVIAMFIFGVMMLGFLSTFMNSRSLTEKSIMHASATTIVYGIIEQIKGLDYSSALPGSPADPADNNSPQINPYLRVKIDQNRPYWLKVKYTPASTATTPTTPAAPLTTPSPTASAADVGMTNYDNVLDPIKLSSVGNAQSITPQLWIWIDEIPDTTRDVTDVKRVTVVYTYKFDTGAGIMTVRDREVFLRTRYNQ